LAKAASVLEHVDEWIRRKLRCYKLKQFKRAKTIASNLIEMGLREKNAWKLAKARRSWWHMSHTPQADRAMGWGWFKLQGLQSLREMYQSL